MVTKRVAACIASCGGLGYVRYAPGTVASAAAMVLYGLLSFIMSRLFLCVATTVMCVVGMWATNKSIVHSTDDPSWIVIDEWVAVWGLCLFLPLSVVQYGCALVLFRVLDIAKPWPISFVQKFPGACGIFSDDFVAAFLAAIFLYCVVIPVIL